MVLRPDQERVSLMLKDTITLLCKNGLTFSSKFSIDAVIGVTLDENDVFLISMNEIIKSDKVRNDSSEAESAEKSKHRHRKRKRGRRKGSECDSSDDSDADRQSELEDSNLESAATSSAVKRRDVKIEPTNEDDGSNDLVFVKQEMDDSWLQTSAQVDEANENNSNIPQFSQSQDFSSLSEMNLMPLGQGQDSGEWNLNMTGHQSQMYAKRGRPPKVGTSPGTSSLQPGVSTEGQQYDASQSSMTSGQIISCRLCMQIFNSESEMVQHIRNQHGNKPGEFVCSLCNKRFTMKSNLKRHEKSHLGIYPYTCELCGKGFYGMERFQTHMTSVHNQQVLESSNR